jgi:ABC-type Fe3+ transport system permease subunit
VFVREFGMSLLLYSTGTETMSVALFSLLRNNATSAAALSLVLTAILLGAVMILRRVSRGDDYV